jgi:hypothetical protein
LRISPVIFANSFDFSAVMFLSDRTQSLQRDRSV